MADFSTLGALIGLAIAIILILRKVHPAYSLILGATVLDSLPHGSFFHATGGSVNMSIKERMALIPYEACVGLTSTVMAVILYLVGM